jgi:thermostable 8-oxoguanine DNA glycosylase
MITPTTITNFNRTEAELEEFLMFAILVAGKGAEQQAKKLEAFLDDKKILGLPSDTTPFQYIQFLSSMSGMLDRAMKMHKLGQYNRISNAFKGIIQFKGRLSQVTIDELESIKGIGSKTARFFILHSRPNQKVAVLDTHILKWMKALGHNVPKATPSKKKYGIIEKIFLCMAEAREMSVADLDLHIWKTYAQKA